MPSSQQLTAFPMIFTKYRSATDFGVGIFDHKIFKIFT